MSKIWPLQHAISEGTFAPTVTIYDAMQIVTVQPQGLSSTAHRMPQDSKKKVQWLQSYCRKCAIFGQNRDLEKSTKTNISFHHVHRVARRLYTIEHAFST